MNNSASHPASAKAGPDPIPEVTFDGRVAFAAGLLGGNGLEIGGLHMPLPVPPGVNVSYVDRMTTPELRREYPELASFDLVEVDIVDNGETLESIRDASQDFIIANHFLEHCEDPIGTIGVHLRKLRPGGLLFYAVPDKRFTFDHLRPVTPIDHVVDDYRYGPSRSRMDHYREWAQYLDTGHRPAEGHRPEQIEAEARRLEADNYSIHMHVWTQAEFLELIIKCREIFEESFDIEAAARRGIEFMVVLRKQGDAAPLSQTSIPAATGTAPFRGFVARFPASVQRRVRRIVQKLRPGP